MKPTLPALITSLLVFFTLHIGGLKANPEFAIGSVSVECSDQASDLSTPTNYYCNPPDWTYTYNIGPNSCTWQWCGMPGANGYIVQWRYPNGSWYNLPGVCYQTWINLTNLQSCTSYEWRVQCNCSGSYSSWCYPCPFNTTCYDCQYPAWQSCNNITDNSATWKWAACEGADYYWIQWCYQGGSWNDYGSCYGTWVNVNNLQSCTSYQWRVKSHCYSGWSNWCTPYSFTTYCNNCPAPYGPFTKDVGITQATLKWSPVSGAVSYSVQIKDNYGTWYDLSGSPTNGVWIIAYNLQPCKTYQWRVKTNCGYYNSYSYWSQPISFTTSCGTGCYAPEWVYTNGITGSSAALHWGTVDGADGYVVEWRPTGGTWNQVQAGNSTVLELNGLSGNSTYEWHVKSHCYSGNYSGWSS
ncbi:MAG: fibronectin type III domain-containing protein, partial [Saprospiraceae bacterium]